MEANDVKTCEKCGLRYDAKILRVLRVEHSCPPSVQPCGACGGQYNSQHVCLPPPVEGA